MRADWRGKGVGGDEHCKSGLAIEVREAGEGRVGDIER